MGEKEGRVLIEHTPNREYISCVCGSTLLALDYDSEDEFLELTMFSYSLRSPMSLWDKIRFCWKAIISGNPYCDDVILGREGIYQLKNYLDKIDEKMYHESKAE